jgi:integrase
MASVFKFPKTSKVWTILYTDEHGNRRKKKGYTDKAETKRFAIRLEEQARKIRDGEIDPRDLGYRDAAAKPLSEHLDAWYTALAAKGSTSKHVETFIGRARRVVAVLAGATMNDIEFPPGAGREIVARIEATLAKSVGSVRLRDLTEERVQSALSSIRADGRSLLTCNHYRTAIKAFSKWCKATHRTRDDALSGVTGFNSKEDRRHDRRTISLDEMQRLIETAEQGPIVMGMSGAARALCYRLAVASGLRYSEIASINPESFDWKAPSVTVAAAYTKNGDPATLPLPRDLADDLAAYVATLRSSTPIFALPLGHGAMMLRHDLKAAGIPYRDAAGLVFDFHSLRCETATLADAAGVSPRVVQKLMRHSSLELTGRYTRPRAVDIEAAAESIPSLKPSGPERIVMTGTDERPVATLFASQENANACNSNGSSLVASHPQWSPPPLRPAIVGPTPVT